MNTTWNENTKRWVGIILPLVLALISALVVSRFAASADFHEKTITALDDKKATVLELTAASTAASAAITLLPGDTATPIAEKLADMSTYFLIVLCAIYVEKYLVTVTGYASFVILIPIACVLYSAGTAIAKDAWKKLARKFALFAIAIVLVIPASVKVSDLIELPRKQRRISRTAVTDSRTVTAAITAEYCQASFPVLKTVCLILRTRSKT